MAVGTNRNYEAIAGIWKLVCALAILVGHNLVTLTEWNPDSVAFHWIFRVLQYFSPFHFFFFSGYLAGAVLMDGSRSLAPVMMGRFLRVHVLVLAALVWGLSVRLLVTRLDGGASLGTFWPLPVWDGPVDWGSVLAHALPFGFVDSTRFNYATWYLYQELRLVLLFPLVRWILLQPRDLVRWTIPMAFLVVSAVLEYAFWPWFPLFRSSPFQSIAFGVVMIGGSLVWRETRPGRILSAIPRPAAWALLLAGLAVASLEMLGIRLPLDNPPVLLVPILLSQTLVFLGLREILSEWTPGESLRKVCDWSVGIYIAHPPVHVFAAWIAVRTESVWPIVGGIAVSILLGVAFHRWIETPSQGWIRPLFGRGRRS